MPGEYEDVSPTEHIEWTEPQTWGEDWFGSNDQCWETARSDALMGYKPTVVTERWIDVYRDGYAEGEAIRRHEEAARGRA